MNFIISLYYLLTELINSLGYLGIFLGMTIESSFFPFPSEIILIPAGTLVFQGQMSFFLVLIFAILGSLAGALINYSIALYIGRYSFDKILEHKKSFLLIKKKNLKKADSFFENHGEITTFIGRLIPVIRQLISLPAGFSKMNLFKFSIFTSLGAGIWAFILILFGYFLESNSRIIQENFKILSLNLFLFSLIIMVIYILIKKSNCSR